MEFKILGPLEVRQNAQLVACKGAKQRLLLATLLLNANQVVSSDRLIDALWGEEPPATAQKALQMHVSQLRRLLEPDLLVTQSPGYELRLDDDELDLRQFEAVVAEARAAAAAGRPEDASALLRDALSLWRGPALADLTFEQFLQPEIARLEELHHSALEDCIDADLELGRHAELVADLEALAAQHPLRERIRAQLMLALYRSGRQADALAAYRDTRRLLIDELGLEPGRELKALEVQILAHDGALEVVERPRPPAASDGLVGRERELAQLMPVIDAAASGEGAVVLIAGEPGIGKSRLAESLARYAEGGGARVAIGRCWEAGGAPPMWPWVQAIQTLRGGARNAAPELLGHTLEDTGDASARFRMFASVAAMLRAEAEGGPIALVLDDIHAADAASLLLLRFVASQVADARVLIIGCYRDTEVAVELKDTLAELYREATVHRVSLKGLDAQATSGLLAAVMGDEPSADLAERVHAETRGNPLFAGEIGRLLAAEGGPDATTSERLPIPEGVRDAIRRRLQRQSQTCRELLTVAAVLGREFDVATVARAGSLGQDELLGAIDEAAAARLIGRVPGADERLRFSHILVRDVLYEELPTSQRLRVHRAVGEALEDLHAHNLAPHVAELAHQFVAAGSLGADKASAYTQRAGDMAVAQFGYEEAARYYAQTLDLLEREGTADAARTCDLLLSLGDARSRAGDAAGAKAAVRRAAAIADDNGWHDRLAQAALAYAGRFAWARASTDPAYVPLLERALAAIGPRDPTARARLLARLASAIRDEPARQRRTALAEEAVAIARSSNDPLTLAYALEGQGVATEGIDPAQDLVTAAELVALGEQLGDKERVFTGRSFQINAYWKLGDRAAIEIQIDALAALADELHQPAQHWSVATERVLLALTDGRFTEAEQMIARARATGDRVERWNARVSERLQLFVLRRAQGRLAELEDVLRRSVNEYPTLLRFRCALAHLYAELDNAPAARAVLAEVSAHDFGPEYLDAEWLFTASLLPVVYRSPGDPATAPTPYTLLLPQERLYAQAPSETTFGSVARGLGVLATTLGRYDDAERHFGVAIEAERSLGARPWLGYAQHDLATMLLERGAPGDEQQARALLVQAIATYRALGMDSWSARAAALD